MQIYSKYMQINSKYMQIYSKYMQIDLKCVHCRWTSCKGLERGSDLWLRQRKRFKRRKICSGQRGNDDAHDHDSNDDHDHDHDDDYYHHHHQHSIMIIFRGVDAVMSGPSTKEHSIDITITQGDHNYNENYKGNR